MFRTRHGKPGSTPFSLTGQPSACGTCREVGTLAHALPGGRVVKNPDHRKEAEYIWKLKPGTIGSKPGYHAVAMFKAMAAGDLTGMWVQVTNPAQSMPNLHENLANARDRFLVVSDVYPTVTTELASVVLPSALWVEKNGVFGNSERRTQQWFKMVDPPVYSQEAHKDIAPYDEYVKVSGMRWPVVKDRTGKWTETARRFVEGEDPFVEKGDKVSFYMAKAGDKKAIAWARPYEPPPEVPDEEYPFWL